MQRGKDIDEAIYTPNHIQEVLKEIESNFPAVFDGFKSKPLGPIFKQAITDFEREQPSYMDYLDPRTLAEFEDNPNPFKNETKTKCPIIRRCLMSNEDIMKQYKISFHNTTGRQLLAVVKNISDFGMEYAATFDDVMHERACTYEELGLDLLGEEGYGCLGVIGYGVQSSLLYGRYPRIFAHRSQNAVWSLYFITNHKSFGLEDGSEFMMADPKYNTCDQNYFYPAELFGFYGLKLYLLLKQACEKLKIHFDDRYRYIYLDAFTNYLADLHREDIEFLRRSSEDVENHWH